MKRDATYLNFFTIQNVFMGTKSDERMPFYGRLQLMCYKHLWDSLVADDFPSRQFFEFFSLNPNRILSAEIRERTAKCGFAAEVLPKKKK